MVPLINTVGFYTCLSILRCDFGGKAELSFSYRQANSSYFHFQSMGTKAEHGTPLYAKMKQVTDPPALFLRFSHGLSKN